MLDCARFADTPVDIASGLTSDAERALVVLRDADPDGRCCLELEAEVVAPMRISLLCEGAVDDSRLLRAGLISVRGAESGSRRLGDIPGRSVELEVDPDEGDLFNLEAEAIDERATGGATVLVLCR